MIIRPAFLLLAFFFLTASLHATTWDEPWMDDVIREADCLVLARVTAAAEDSVAVTIVRTVAGKEIGPHIVLTRFHQLHLCSMSGGHGPEFGLEGVDSIYLFIRGNSDSGYGIATPTTGFAVVEEGRAIATYRHSYHQAYASIGLYEKTMSAIFNHYHDRPYDTASVRAYADSMLALPPVPLTEENVETFFAQHVALETIHHLRLPGYYERLVPFARDTGNFHNAISGARALVAEDSEECRRVLLEMVADESVGDFVRVMALRSLLEFDPTDLREELIEIGTTASDEMNGFGGGIMDPRVCTGLPSVKKAIEKAVEKMGE